MVGLEKDQEDSIDVHNLPLQYHKGIYLAPKNYTSCQPLPAEWLSHIPNIKKYNKEINSLVKRGVFEDKEATEMLRSGEFSQELKSETGYGMRRTSS